MCFNPEEIRRAMDEFLNRYNPERREETAIVMAIGAGIKHNRLYGIALSIEHRDEIKIRWAGYLREIAAWLVAHPHATQDEYNEKICYLKDSMNAAFHDWFTPEGFKISHAQKSISVYLKHLWCMGRVPMPPECPIDRTVLKAIGLKGHDAAWTGINTIDEHREKMKLIEEYIKKYSISQ